MAPHYLVFLCTAFVMFSCIMTAWTAPSTERRRALLDDQTNMSDIFDALSSKDKALSRVKRHLASDAVTSELLAAIDTDASATSAQRRQRRSAVFYLTASMQFCRNYPIYCRRIEVDAGDVKVKIKLAEE